MEIFSTRESLSKVVRELRASGKTIGLVPTMGALHGGHLSLVRQSIKETDVTIVTVFLNPMQFSAEEDLCNYPKTLEADVTKLTIEGVSFVFAPSNEEMYPEGFSTSIIPPSVAKTLEGEFRPEHFVGVVTVVLKLLNLTQASKVFFGQKDFQQTIVIKQMIEDLNVPTEIRVCPIVRDPDGLAMSSRNVYLSPEERKIALSLSKTLDHVQNLIAAGLRDGFELITEMRQKLIDSGVERIEYAVVTDPKTLVTVDPIELPVVALIAAYVGTTRLIDNRVFTAN